VYVTKYLWLKVGGKNMVFSFLLPNFTPKFRSGFEGAGINYTSKCKIC
jgi:hypothetical protein